ncbi:MAG: dienelactone hydrolase family protein, partial [Granulosicoccus sp.]|nr:dienelactone hydrolase family protein [Granulosicoccus sp.]
AARDALAGYSPVSIVGYCLGGSVAFAAATRLDGFLLSIPYYGGMIHGIIEEQPRCPVLMYFGEQDHSISPEDVRDIQDAQPSATIRLVDAQHGFMCDHRATYSEDIAKQAWDETLQYLDQHSGGSK